jgi:hypothetical protein
MPVSADENIQPLLNYLENINEGTLTIIDLGVGYGNIGRAVREKLPNALLIGVEIWEPYLIRNQDKVYDRIIIGDVIKTLRIIEHSDVILAFDIIEHFDKNMGAWLIREYQSLVRICLLVSLPIINYEQRTKKNNPYEEHKYQWTIKEMELLGGKLIFKGEIVGIFMFQPYEISKISGDIQNLYAFETPVFLGFCKVCNKNISLTYCPSCNRKNSLWWDRYPPNLLKKTLGLFGHKNPQPVENFTLCGIVCMKCGWKDKIVMCPNCNSQIEFNEMVLLTKKTKNKI